MAKRYDPVMCMMVDEPTKAQDELSLAQKKQVVTELKGYLKKSYNFSDESEYVRAYEDLHHMFTTGSRKSISGLFENTVKKTGAKDSASALDKAIKTCDAVEVETSEWSFSSGKSKPSGLGNWWFKIGTEEKNFYGNWSNAKAEAIKYAKEKGINRIHLMT